MTLPRPGWHPREEDEVELLRLELDECVKEIKRLRAELAEALATELRWADRRR